MSDLSPLSGVKRKLDFGAVRAALDPERTSDVPQIYLLRPAPKSSQMLVGESTGGPSH